MKLPLLEQSNGQKSVSFTMMIIGFFVITFWLFLSIVEEIAGIQIREFDGAEAMAYFTPLAALYFGRRWTVDIQGKNNTADVANSLRPPPSSE